MKFLKSKCLLMLKFRTKSQLQQSFCLLLYPANICLDEDFLRTSFFFVFRRRRQDVLIKANIFSLVIRLQKTSSRRLGQDQYIRLGYMSPRVLQDVFKTSSRHLQDVFKTFSRPLAKISSRCFQDVSLS